MTETAGVIRAAAYHGVAAITLGTLRLLLAGAPDDAQLGSDGERFTLTAADGTLLCTFLRRPAEPEDGEDADTPRYLARREPDTSVPWEYTMSEVQQHMSAQVAARSNRR